MSELFLIVLLGDSISHDRNFGWVHRVRDSGVVSIRNLSEGGASAKSWALVEDYGRFSPWGTTWGMIALGTNDAAGISHRTVFDFYFDLLTISDRMFDAGAPRVILLLIPIESWLQSTRYKRLQFNALMSVMCQHLEEFVCIDVSDVPLRFFNYPNPHPTFLGHKWMATRIESEIRALKP